MNVVVPLESVIDVPELATIFPIVWTPLPPVKIPLERVSKEITDTEPVPVKLHVEALHANVPYTLQAFVVVRE